MNEIKININPSQSSPPAPSGHNRTRVAVAAVVLLAAVIGVVFYFKNKDKQSPPATGQNNSLPVGSSDSGSFVSQSWLDKTKEAAKVAELNKTPQQTQTVANTSAPANFPKDLPLENVSSANVLENKLETYHSGTVGLRTYTSSKSVAQNYDLFKNYFDENIWQVKQDPKNTEQAMQLFATKGKQSATVAISLDKSTNKVKVTIYFREIVE